MFSSCCVLHHHLECSVGFGKGREGGRVGGWEGGAAGEGIGVRGSRLGAGGDVGNRNGGQGEMARRGLHFYNQNIMPEQAHTFLMKTRSVYIICDKASTMDLKTISYTALP